MEKIDVCFACDENYAPYAGCVLLSLLDYHSKEELRVWFISDNISQKTKLWIEKNFSGMDVFFRDIPQGFLTKVPIRNKHLSRAAYARLALGSVLPKEVKRVIYLDCDILVLHSIRDLWNWDLKGKVLAGVEDWGLFLQRREGDFYYPFSTSYKSSGLLLIDVEKWRSKCCENKCLDYLRKPQYPILYEDQDVLNFALYSEFGELPPEWNVVLNFSKKEIEKRGAPASWIVALKDPFIVHFASANKPWLEFCSLPYKLEFQKYMQILGLETEKLSFKNKIRYVLYYWVSHPIFFLKPKFWRKRKTYGWGVFK